METQLQQQSEGGSDSLGKVLSFHEKVGRLIPRPATCQSVLGQDTEFSHCSTDMCVWLMIKKNIIKHFVEPDKINKLINRSIYAQNQPQYQQARLQLA